MKVYICVTKRASIPLAPCMLFFPSSHNLRRPITINWFTERLKDKFQLSANTRYARHLVCLSLYCHKDTPHATTILLLLILLSLFEQRPDAIYVEPLPLYVLYVYKDVWKKGGMSIGNDGGEGGGGWPRSRASLLSHYKLLTVPAAGLPSHLFRMSTCRATHTVV